MTTPAFTCPCCGAISHHPKDIEFGYCARCRWWTGDPNLGPGHLAEPCQAGAFDGDLMFRDFAGDIANRLRRLEVAGMMPEAVLLRADLWPQVIGNWNGYPLIRIEPSSPRMWGVLA